MVTNASLNKVKILVVDDEPDLRTLYELTLLREGYSVEAAASIHEARQVLEQQRFDVIITDMRLPDGMGMELLQRVKSERRVERCVVITAYGSAENAVEALKAGAFDYLTKPVDLKQFRAVIASAILDAARPASERRMNSTPRQVTAVGTDRLAGNRTVGTSSDPSPGDTALKRMVGESNAMRIVRERIVKVARSMAPILVRGESGTGKELAARAVHANSHRANGPLIAVNCSAIPENLLESEFFGSMKGSFTGAAHDRVGFFQAASGGTLFLDEIGDLPSAMQSKLLRAIQERCVRPVGATQEEPVDVRIVSATNKDLAAEVTSGRFRQDLFYRLNVIEVLLPPLRERLEDLPALCEALLKRIANESCVSVPAVSPHMLDWLSAEPLRGNVRELENILHRALALSDGEELQVDSVPVPTTSAPLSDGHATTPIMETLRPGGKLPLGGSTSLQDHLDSQEREILVRTLQETGFNRTLAATRLGMSLRQIRYRIARLNIDVPHGNEPNEEPG